MVTMSMRKNNNFPKYYRLEINGVGIILCARTEDS